MDSKVEFYSLQSGQEFKEIILKSTFKDDFFDVFAGKREYNETIKTSVKLGSKLYDVLYFDEGVNFVISEKLYQLLKNNNITGWQTYSVNIEGFTEAYYGFQIIGRSGALIVPEKEGFYKGCRFNIDTWDGSDFFSPKGTYLRFITPKLKRLLEANNVTNIEIDNIKDIEAYSFGK